MLALKKLGIARRQTNFGFETSADWTQIFRHRADSQG